MRTFQVFNFIVLLWKNLNLQYIIPELLFFVVVFTLLLLIRYYFAKTRVQSIYTKWVCQNWYIKDFYDRIIDIIPEKFANQNELYFLTDFMYRDMANTGDPIIFLIKKKSSSLRFKCFHILNNKDENKNPLKYLAFDSFCFESALFSLYDYNIAKYLKENSITIYNVRMIEKFNNILIYWFDYDTNKIYFSESKDFKNSEEVYLWHD